MCQRLWDYRTRCSKMWPFHFSAFLPRDAMLVRHGRVSVCLSVFVTSPSSVETDEEMELSFGAGVSFHLSYAVREEIRVSQNTVTLEIT